MSEAIDSRPFPKGALIAGAFLVTASLALATMARLTGFGATHLDLAPVTVQRDLAFKDMPGGAIGIYDVKADSQIALLAPGESGFVRVVMRGLARERTIAGAGPELPFRLETHTDGMSTLQDLATGRTVTLRAFGEDNAEAFLKLLDAGSMTP